MSEGEASAEAAEKLLGTTVLDFELTSVLGAGGMSVVYHGQHRLTGQAVAIKILPPELAVHEELKARFVEEARVLALLEHPNIVTLNNFTESQGRLCLIMQFVDGVTFEHRIVEAGQVPVDEALRVGIEVLAALEYAHSQQVIHRDIKPSNVLVRTDGAVKVTDFGIAKIVGNSRLTSTGQTMGTVRYMSPEQVRGKPIDARSDLYSLGVTIYEALAGRTPFEGDSQFAIMEQHLNRKPPPLSQFCSGVPAALERALGRAMAKSAEDRFPDARAFRLELELARVASQGTLPARPGVRPKEGRGRGPRSRRRLVTAALGGMAAVAAAGGGYLVSRRSPGPAGSGGAGVVATKASPPSARPAARRPPPGPYRLAGVRFRVDQEFPSAALRVQSVAPRDPEQLRDRVAALRKELGRFLAASDEPAARQAEAAWAPLNLAVVPQSILNQPSLWPGYRVAPDSTYPSRYVDSNRTLFVNDTKGFEERDLAYGLALHALAPIEALSNQTCLELAEQFEAWHLAQRGR